MGNASQNLVGLYWAMGVFGTILIAALGWVIVLWRDTGELSKLVAGWSKAAEIYERTQMRMSEDNTKAQAMLLQTLQAITGQHADMYRELSSRFSTLEERSNNHGQELRRIANNVHDTRAECREAISKTHDELRSEIQRVDDVHRDDMARIQMRRQGDAK